MSVSITKGSNQTGLSKLWPRFYIKVTEQHLKVKDKNRKFHVAHLPYMTMILLTYQFI